MFYDFVMFFHTKNLITPDIQNRCARNHLNDKNELYFTIGRKLVILIECGTKAHVLCVVAHTSPPKISRAELPDTSQSSIKGEILLVLEHLALVV